MLFKNGILGVSFERVLIAIIVLAITFLIAYTIKKSLGKLLEKSPKTMKMDHSRFFLLKHFLTAITYLIGIGIAIYLIPPLKSLSISLFAGAGILAVIIGFASQQAFSNLISGVFIAIFKPFRVGDTIKFSDKAGVVEDITLRHTIIRNFENKRFVVPNSKISEEIIENYNLSDEKICKWVDMSISYDSNVNKAMKIMKEEAERHPDCLDTRNSKQKREKKPIVNVRLIKFGESSVNLRAWVWTKNPAAAFRMGCDLNKRIKERFDKAGIEIPFPYRTIVFKNKKKKGR